VCVVRLTTQLLGNLPGAGAVELAHGPVVVEVAVDIILVVRLERTFLATCQVRVPSSWPMGHARPETVLPSWRLTALITSRISLPHETVS